MKVEFSFDEKAVKGNGLKRSDIYFTIKKEFAIRGLPCISDNEILAFEDRGGQDDFSYMWIVLMGLLKTEWFAKCASACIFHDDDDTQEDVLSQAWKVQKMMA